MLHNSIFTFLHDSKYHTITVFHQNMFIFRILRYNLKCLKFYRDFIFTYNLLFFELHFITVCALEHVNL